MIGLDVTHRALITDAHTERMRGAGRVGKVVAELMDFYARFHKTRYPDLAGSPMHDPVCIAHLIDPTLLDVRDAFIEVDCTTGPSWGRTNVDWRNREHFGAPNAKVGARHRRRALRRAGRRAHQVARMIDTTWPYAGAGRRRRLDGAGQGAQVPAWPVPERGIDRLRRDRAARRAGVRPAGGGDAQGDGGARPPLRLRAAGGGDRGDAARRARRRALRRRAVGAPRRRRLAVDRRRHALRGAGRSRARRRLRAVAAAGGPAGTRRSRSVRPPPGRRRCRSTGAP